MKRFRILKALLKEKDIDQRYLGELINRSSSYVSFRLTGRYSWELREMYKMMDILNAPYETMHIIFPKDGLDKPLEEVPFVEKLKAM